MIFIIICTIMNRMLTSVPVNHLGGIYMLQRFSITKTEVTLLVLLLSFPIIEFIFREWIPFGGSLWDKAVLFALFLVAFPRKFETNRLETGLTKQFSAFIILGLLLLVYYIPYFSISFEGFRSIYQYMIAFFIGYYFFRYIEDWTQALRIFLFVGTAIALYGLAQPFLGVQMPDSWVDSGEAMRFRAFSIVQSPNVLGGYMAFLIPISMSLFFAEKKKSHKYIWAVVSFVLLACLFATLSRGAWIAFALAMVVFATLIKRRLLIFVLIAGLLVVLFVPTVGDRITYMFSETYMEKSASDGRVARWTGALDQAINEPFFGKGLGQYGGAVAQRNFGISYVDNYYAKTVAELGFVGLTLFVWLLLSILYQAYRRFTDVKDNRTRWLMRGVFAGISAVILHNGVENIFEVPFMAVYFWFFAGSLLAAPLMVNRKVVNDK